MSFEKAFELARKKDAELGCGLYESIVSKLYRHEYSWIGHDIIQDVTAFLDQCGIKYKLTEKTRLATKLEIVKTYKVEVTLEYVGTRNIYPVIETVDASSEEEAREKAELLHEAPLKPCHVVGSRIVE